MFFSKNGLINIESNSNEEFCDKLKAGLADGTIEAPWGFKVYNSTDYWIVSCVEARKYVPTYEIAFTLTELQTIIDSVNILNGKVEYFKTPFVYQTVADRLKDIKLTEPLTMIDDVEDYDNHELTLMGRILWFKTKVDKKNREYLLLKVTDRSTGDKQGTFINFYENRDLIKKFKGKVCLFKVMRTGSYTLGIKFKALEEASQDEEEKTA